MKKIFIVFACVIILFNLTSCNRLSDINQRILAPIAKITPLDGKWKIIKVLNNGNIKTKPSDNWIGKEAEFSNKVVIVGDYILYNPNYKIRRLNTDEYLLSSRKAFNNKINIPASECDVITITGKDKFLGEALKINDKQIILDIYNYNLLLTKISNSSDEFKSKKIDITGKTELNGSKQDNFIRTGVLIGLRSPISQKNNSKLIHYEYRTLWVASKNRVLHPILETKNIFFPRKSGFWEIGVNNLKRYGISNDSIFAININMGIKNSSFDSNKERISIKKVIGNNILNYVGNDYISIENNSEDKKGIISKLNIIPIDSLPNLKATKIGDITSNEGINTLNINSQNLINSNFSENVKIYDKKNIDNNFGLVRKAGHWYFEGRINFFNSSGMYFKDYSINIIPPSNLVFYDELSITWTDIKERVPDAMDAYTSPNKDIAIILVKNNKLLIYEINKGKLGTMPLKQIKLKPSEKIIMSEWATGSYVENWEKSFMGLM